MAGIVLKGKFGSVPLNMWWEEGWGGSAAQFQVTKDIRGNCYPPKTARRRDKAKNVSTCVGPAAVAQHLIYFSPLQNGRATGRYGST